MTNRLPSWLADWRGLCIALALFVVLVACSWVGFIGSDDVTYARGAYGWIEQFPFVGGHGTIRYPLTIPMALSFLTFGEHEVAMVLPSLLYLLGFLALAWRLTRSAAGSAAALGALALLVTSPLLVIQASIASVDIVELFFVFASFAFFWTCLDEGVDRVRLILAGVMAGCAFLTRETAIFIALFYAPLFLIGHRMRRLDYLWIALGFIAAWAVELVYLGIMTGDPLYRFNISLNHDSTIDRSIDLAGNMIVHPLVDPLLVLLLNQEFMFLFLLAIPLGAWLCVAKDVEPGRRHYVRLVAWLGISWFLCTGAALTLLPLNPRYFMIPCVAACILTGVALVRIAARGGRAKKMAVAAMAVIFAGNFGGIYVENKDSLFGERTLAQIVAANPRATIVTDPMTRYRADLLLRWAGAGGRVLDRPPVAGDLYFFNPSNAAKANFKMPADRVEAYVPDPDWKVVGYHRVKPTYAAHIVAALGMDSVLAPRIWQKLRERHQPVTMLQVPSTQ